MQERQKANELRLKFRNFMTVSVRYVCVTKNPLKPLQVVLMGFKVD